MRAQFLDAVLIPLPFGDSQFHRNRNAQCYLGLNLGQMLRVPEGIL